MTVSLNSLPSPNQDSRNSQAVDMLVLHYTGMPSGPEALARLIDPEAKVSAHYVIEENGDIFALVDESLRSWHAGVSSWRGHTNINARSIGIEIVNPGHEWGYRNFPAAQMQSVAALCRDILSRHAVPARNVVGHSDVAFLRKEDPGERFDWAWLAEQGVGVWPKQPSGSRQQASAQEVQQQLSLYGYGIEPTGAWDEPTKHCIIAFQRHFRPGNLNGRWDTECQGLLETLLVN